MELRDKEFESLLRTEGPKRYKYLVRSVVESQLVWSLAGPDGWVLMGDAEDRELTPIWPYAQCAQAFAVDEWRDTEPRSIPLDEWLENWIPGLAEDERLIAAFPVPSGQGVIVSPDRLKQDIEQELEWYQ